MDPVPLWGTDGPDTPKQVLKPGIGCLQEHYPSNVMSKSGTSCWLYFKTRHHPCKEGDDYYVSWEHFERYIVTENLLDATWDKFQITVTNTQDFLWQARLSSRLRDQPSWITVGLRLSPVSSLQVYSIHRYVRCAVSSPWGEMFSFRQEEGLLSEAGKKAVQGLLE